MIRHVMIAAICAMVLAGCATASTADVYQRDAQLKMFNTTPGLSGIYIYRDQTMNAGISAAVLVDGKPLGNTNSKTYYFVQVLPGVHTIASKSGDYRQAKNRSKLTIRTAPDHLYFVRQSMKVDTSVRTMLQQVSATDGKKGVVASRLLGPRLSLGVLQ